MEQSTSSHRYLGSMRGLTYLWIIAGGVAVYCWLVFFGSYHGIRGADQFWYLADIESLIEGRGAYSNLVFPYTVFTDAYSGPRPFVHNILYPYLSALPGRIIGPFAGGIVTNAANYILAALIIFLLVIRLCGDKLLAAFVSTMFLFFPINYWLSINVLAESTLASLVAILAAVSISDKWPGWQWFAASLVIGIMVFARGSMMLFAVMLPIAFFITDKSIVKRRLLASLGLLATMLGFIWFWSHFFEHNVPCSLVDRLNINVPGKSTGMYCLFKMPDQSLMLVGWMEKVAQNLSRQFRFSDIYSWLFYWPINLLVLLGGYVFLKSTDRSIKTLGLLNLGFALVQLGTLVITQNQFRYLAPLVPISFILLAVFLNNYKNLFIGRYRYILCMSVIVATLFIDHQFARRARNDAQLIAVQMEQLMTYVRDNIRPGDLALLESSEDTHGISLAIRVGFTLNPRATLMVPASYQAGEYDMLLAKFSPDVLILRDDSVLHEKLSHLSTTRISTLPGDFSGYSLFRMN